MRKTFSAYMLAALMTPLLLVSPISAGPTGAKAIFDSGEGPAVQISSRKAGRSPGEAPQNYVGISYELLLLANDGQIRKVTKNRPFRSGERIIMRVVTNRSGNLKVYNIGPTGNTNVLFDEPVNAYTMTQVPANSNFQFVGNPGTETLLIMLADVQSPGDANPPVTAAAADLPPPAPAAGDLPTPAPAAGGMTQPAQGGEPSQVAGVAKMKPSAPPPTVIASNIEGAKKVKGGKDIVTEDRMQSSFSVVSPNEKWKPARSGMKDVVIESSNGTNYGVVPVSAVSNGGILSLTVKLKHR
jgi:Domain of unknown function (DUF4384)